jgi:hypothetical protein
MGLHMSDFKLSFLGQRRRGAAGAGRPLDELVEQIQALDAAAQQASRRINQSARKLRASHKWHPDANEDLLAELADSLVARAEAIRDDCERLAALLDRAREVVGGDPSHGEDSSEMAADVAASVLSGDGGDVSIDSVWQGPIASLGGDVGIAEGVRLIATQMAIAGSTRAEIESRLREQFGIEEARPVLDEIFGQSAAKAT